MKILISGGGTGGHIFPAIAIADALKRKLPETEILFVGAKGRLEMERVPQSGYLIKGLWISGFQRSLTWKNLLFPFKLMHSAIQARKIVKEFQPDVVVGVGGYASGPTLDAALRMGIPVVLQEQNSYAGVTNKLLGRKASKICVAYEGMEKFFPKEKIILTGNPIRAGIETKGKKEAGLEHYGLSADKKTILVIGGSLGAKSLNEAMESNEELLKTNPEVQVLWQCGKYYYNLFSQGKTAALANVNIRPFLEKMDLAYALADIVISRAGALSISELCIVGKPAILVPSPNVAEDHQTKNAMSLVAKDAAILIKDSEANSMIPTAISMLSNGELMSRMSSNIRSLAKPDAADEIADIIITLI